MGKSGRLTQRLKNESLTGTDKSVAFPKAPESTFSGCFNLAYAANFTTYRKSPTRKYSSVIASRSAATTRRFVTTALTANESIRATTRRITRIAVTAIEISNNWSRCKRDQFHALTNDCIHVSSGSNGANERYQFAVTQTATIRISAGRRMAVIKARLGIAASLPLTLTRPANIPAAIQAMMLATVTPVRAALIAKQARRVAPGASAGRTSVACLPIALKTIQQSERIKPPATETRSNV